MKQTRMRKGSPEPADVKTLREDSGLSQSAVAELLDVDISAYQRWESGQTSMPGAAWQLMQLCVLTGCERDFINQNGFVLSERNDAWLMSEFHNNESRFIKGILMCSLLTRGVDLPQDSSLLSKFYSRCFGMAAATQAELLTYASDRLPFIRGFAIARLVQNEISR